MRNAILGNNLNRFNHQLCKYRRVISTKDFLIRHCTVRGHSEREFTSCSHLFHNNRSFNYETSLCQKNKLILLIIKHCYHDYSSVTAENLR